MSPVDLNRYKAEKNSVFSLNPNASKENKH
jgi:hypothetical protein